MSLWQSQTWISRQESYPTYFKFLKLRSGEDMEKLLMGMYSNAAAIENSLAFPQEIKHGINVTQQFHF